MRDYTFEKCDYNNDMYSLYKMMCSNDQYLYSTKLTFNTEQSFSKWITRRIGKVFHDFYIVKDSERRNIGFVYNYDFSLQDGHCKICVYIAEEYRSTGIGGFVSIDFVKYLFEKYPIQKVYLTIYDYNQQSLSSNLSAGYIEEGIIKEYRYYDGKYHDMHYLSITRERFDEKLGKFACSIYN